MRNYYLTLKNVALFRLQIDEGENYHTYGNFKLWQVGLDGQRLITNSKEAGIIYKEAKNLLKNPIWEVGNWSVCENEEAAAILVQTFDDWKKNNLIWDRGLK